MYVCCLHGQLRAGILSGYTRDTALGMVPKRRENHGFPETNSHLLLCVQEICSVSWISYIRCCNVSQREVCSGASSSQSQATLAFIHDNSELHLSERLDTEHKQSRRKQRHVIFGIFSIQCLFASVCRVLPRITLHDASFDGLLLHSAAQSLKLNKTAPMTSTYILWS
jgi:hypothetical protein